MSLQEQLDATRSRIESSIGQDPVSIMHKETADLELSGFVENALNVGDTIPNFQLPNTFGVDLDLYNVLEKEPIVISFYRGAWCPYCNLELQALNNALSEIKNKHACLIAISPQTPDNSLSLQEKLHLKFEVLSDIENRVAKKLGLVFKFSPELENLYKNGFGLNFETIYGEDNYELPVPATYVIGQDKKVKYAFLNVDYTKRAEPSEIIEALNNL
ncbi:alkyl hydroperoxide reductase [Arcobacter sp. CECT 8989]|uniref:peroxiredoxin-like family protein n=1 Tax=Arcobacter sp. CECT 8989 TaxID=2044509 RepID=UPI00100AE474|nr:peroxiredoxin-like family protein [Arcobacter sp. CECT 8989]RXJ98969.1 alkyl hydroperoxide reductase [Arcobacter sp. CECT 8989]